MFWIEDASLSVNNENVSVYLLRIASKRPSSITLQHKLQWTSLVQTKSCFLARVDCPSARLESSIILAPRLSRLCRRNLSSLYLSIQTLPRYRPPKAWQIRCTSCRLRRTMSHRWVDWWLDLFAVSKRFGRIQYYINAMLKPEWRIIARWSSVFLCVVHADDFVWFMFVHGHFGASEQTLNTRKHLSEQYKGKHEIKVQ